MIISIETSLTNITLKLLKEVRSEISSFYAAIFTLILSTLGMLGAFGETTNKLGLDQLKIMVVIAILYVIQFQARPKAMQNIDLRYFSIIQQINFVLV